MSSRTTKEDHGGISQNSYSRIPKMKKESPPPQSQAPTSKPKTYKPDHGQNFVPGSESAPDNLAPQPLDHFKRGYKERAELRDREMSHLNMDFEHQNSNMKDDRRHNYNAGRPVAPPPQSFQPRNRGDRMTNNHNMPQMHMGFEVTELVNRLSAPGCALNSELNHAREMSPQSFESGKAITAILSHLARRKKMGVALAVWQWMQDSGINRNVFHFNSLISVCEKMKDWQRAVNLLTQMEKEGVKKNEVTFSSAISACEKSGNWRKALELLDQMKREGIQRTAIAYNAAISACEKGLNPAKALEIFEQMKAEGVKPTVITYSALISACEKGQQWKLALEVLEEMKKAGHGANVIAYSAAISALSKGQQWEKALELFREIEASGGKPSVVTYNATMTALEKGLQWERALDLFDEMKHKNLPVTVVSYGSAISACEKGYQWRQCLDFLDEMTERRIRKNVIIFGAAMSCMEKSCRADIAFQLMDRMKIEGVSPNVHIYNSAISACARCNLWEKGLELFYEMDKVGVVKDVVTYNAVLDAVCSQVQLARKLFQEGVEKGFYARVSRLGTQWLELDLHFLSLGGGEIALGWWFEECLVPYLGNHEKLAAVKSIDIVTGYGKTRMRGARHGDDGMRKRVRAMLRFMSVREIEQPNKGRIHIDKEALTREVERNGGKIIFDSDGYRKFRIEETTANAMPNVPQVRRSRWPARPDGAPSGNGFDSLGGGINRPPNENTWSYRQDGHDARGHHRERSRSRDRDQQQTSRRHHEDHDRRGDRHHRHKEPNASHHDDYHRTSRHHDRNYQEDDRYHSHGVPSPKRQRSNSDHNGNGAERDGHRRHDGRGYGTGLREEGTVSPARSNMSRDGDRRYGSSHHASSKGHGRDYHPDRQEGSRYERHHDRDGQCSSKRRDYEGDHSRHETHNKPSSYPGNRFKQEEGGMARRFAPPAATKIGAPQSNELDTFFGKKNTNENKGADWHQPPRQLNQKRGGTSNGSGWARSEPPHQRNNRGKEDGAVHSGGGHGSCGHYGPM